MHIYKKGDRVRSANRMTSSGRQTRAHIVHVVTIRGWVRLRMKCGITMGQDHVVEATDGADLCKFCAGTAKPRPHYAGYLRKRRLRD